MIRKYQSKDDLFAEIASGGLGEQSEFGDLLTITEFMEYCDSGGFIDYDGSGNLATETKESSINIYPSNRLKTLTLNPWATHIMWYNR